MRVHEFYKIFFQKDKIPSVYPNIYYSHNQSVFYTQNNSTLKNDTEDVNFIKLFPKYLKVDVLSSEKYHLKKITQAKLDGFGIILNDEKDIDSYLLNNFKSSSRSPIKRRAKRLEECFSIKYEFFFGNNLLKENYDTIMQALKEMLVRRFDQKNDINEALDTWNTYHQNSYNQIINNEASLFVIYENENIISISLNYHAKKVFKGHLLAYDIDYSKFSLGNTVIYKLLDWCLKNNYSILDMGNGELEYKNIWSNFSYHYEYHFFYKKKSVKAFLVAHYIMTVIKIKNTLKKLNIAILIEKIKNLILLKKKPKIETNQYYKVDELSIDVFNNQNVTKIDSSNPSYKKLKKIICDYLFLQKEHMDTVEVYCNIENVYFVKGKTSIIKISLEN